MSAIASLKSSSVIAAPSTFARILGSARAVAARAARRPRAPRARTKADARDRAARGGNILMGAPIAGCVYTALSSSAARIIRNGGTCEGKTPKMLSDPGVARWRLAVAIGPSRDAALTADVPCSIFSISAAFARGPDRQKRRHPAPRQFIGAFVHRIARVAPDPAPVDFVTLGRFIEAPPKVVVLHRLPVPGAPAVAFPIAHPGGHAVAQILGIGVQFDDCGTLESLECGDRGRQLHAIVGGQRLAAAQVLLA